MNFQTPPCQRWGIVRDEREDQGRARWKECIPRILKINHASWGKASSKVLRRRSREGWGMKDVTEQMEAKKVCLLGAFDSIYRVASSYSSGCSSKTTHFKRDIVDDREWDGFFSGIKTKHPLMWKNLLKIIKG